MKIKIFDTNIHMFGADNIESKVNEFMQNNSINVISVETSCTNERLVITVVYKEEI